MLYHTQMDDEIPALIFYRPEFQPPSQIKSSAPSLKIPLIPGDYRWVDDIEQVELSHLTKSNKDIRFPNRARLEELPKSHRDYLNEINNNWLYSGKLGGLTPRKYGIHIVEKKLINHEPIHEKRRAYYVPLQDYKNKGYEQIYTTNYEPRVGVPFLSTDKMNNFDIVFYTFKWWHQNAKIREKKISREYDLGNILNDIMNGRLAQGGMANIHLFGLKPQEKLFATLLCFETTLIIGSDAVCLNRLDKKSSGKIEENKIFTLIKPMRKPIAEAYEQYDNYLTKIQKQYDSIISAFFGERYLAHINLLGELIKQRYKWADENIDKDDNIFTIIRNCRIAPYPPFKKFDRHSISDDDGTLINQMILDHKAKVICQIGVGDGLSTAYILNALEKTHKKGASHFFALDNNQDQNPPPQKLWKEIGALKLIKFNNPTPSLTDGLIDLIPHFNKFDMVLINNPQSPFAIADHECILIDRMIKLGGYLIIIDGELTLQYFNDATAYQRINPTSPKLKILKKISKTSTPIKN